MTTECPDDLCESEQDSIMEFYRHPIDPIMDDDAWRLCCGHVVSTLHMTLIRDLVPDLTYCGYCSVESKERGAR